MIQAKHHCWVKQKKKKMGKGESVHRKIRSWDCNGLKAQVSVSETSADDLELILTNFTQGKHDSSAAYSSVALQGADVLLIRSTIRVSGKQGILLAQALMELNYACCFQLLASTTSQLCRQRLVVTGPHVGPPAVPLDFLVHAASHGSCTYHLSREFHLCMLREEQNPSDTSAFVQLAHTFSLTHTSTHLEHLFPKPLSKAVKLYQSRSATLRCWPPSQQLYDEYSNLFSWHSFCVIQ